MSEAPILDLNLSSFYTIPDIVTEPFDIEASTESTATATVKQFKLGSPTTSPPAEAEATHQDQPAPDPTSHASSNSKRMSFMKRQSTLALFDSLDRPVSLDLGFDSFMTSLSNSSKPEEDLIEKQQAIPTPPSRTTLYHFSPPLQPRALAVANSKIQYTVEWR